MFNVFTLSITHYVTSREDYLEISCCGCIISGNGAYNIHICIELFPTQYIYIYVFIVHIFDISQISLRSYVCLFQENYLYAT